MVKSSTSTWFATKTQESRKGFAFCATKIREARFSPSTTWIRSKSANCWHLSRSPMLVANTRISVFCTYRFSVASSAWIMWKATGSRRCTATRMTSRRSCALRVARRTRRSRPTSLKIWNCYPCPRSRKVEVKFTESDLNNIVMYVRLLII